LSAIETEGFDTIEIQDVIFDVKHTHFAHSASIIRSIIQTASDCRKKSTSKIISYRATINIGTRATYSSR
jgi:hypothetical protein